MNEPTNQTAARKTNRWRPILIFVASLIVVYAAYRFALLSLVSTRVQAIRRSGLPATLEELNNWYSQVPAGENAAELYALADERCDRWTNALLRKVVISSGKHSVEAKTKADLLPIMGYVKSPGRKESLSLETRQLVRDYLKDNEEAVQLLHAASKRKQCRFPVDFTQRSIGSLSFLSQSRHAARLLTLEAMLEAADQQPDKAAESLIAQARLDRAFGNEPWLISHLGALALEGISIASLEESLNKTGFTDSQLTKVAAVLREMEDTDGLFRALVGERCSGIDAFEEIRSGEVAVADTIYPSDENHPWFVELSFVYKAAGLLERDELAYLDVMDGLIQAARFSPPRSVLAVKYVIAKAKRRPLETAVTTSRTNYLDRAVIHDAQVLGHIRAAIASVAVERFRLQMGTLPGSLDELVPAFLAAVPEDPFDGKPLRYKRNVHGYVVYSINEDGKDDGGAERNAEGLIRGPGTDITFIVEN